MRRFLRFRLGGMEGIKGDRIDRQSDRAENHHQNELDLGCFEVQKVRIVIKNALCLYLKISSSRRREAIFQKIREKMLPESEKWSHNYVRYTKIPPTWGRIHEDGVKIMSDISVKSPKEATCSNNTHKCNVFWGSAWEAWRG